MAFHGPAQHAHQLLTCTMDTLATGHGDVRSRLLFAYPIFQPLTPEHFPEHLREDFRWIKKQLTKQEPYIDHEGRVQKGSVQVSLEHMRNSTGVKIVQKLRQLHYALDAYVNPR